MSKVKVSFKTCEICKKQPCPSNYKKCITCHLKYNKQCKCGKFFDSYLYKQCYECSQKNFKPKTSQKIDIDALELLSEDD